MNNNVFNKKFPGSEDADLLQRLCLCHRLLSLGLDGRGLDHNRLIRASDHLGPGEILSLN